MPALFGGIRAPSTLGSHLRCYTWGNVAQLEKAGREFLAELARTVPYYTFRLAVPPGLTGWAQVNMPYARSEEEHRRKLEYDLYFIRERSFGMYLLTLLRTVSVALVGARR